MTHDHTHCKGVWMSEESLANICTGCLRFSLHREVETGKYKSTQISYFKEPPGNPIECKHKITI